jgi:hypothetical protein
MLPVAEGGCTYTWTLSANTNVGGGVFNSASSAAACQAVCITTPNCTGVDWDSNTAATQRCWLTVAPAGQRFNGTAMGVTHYDLTTNCNGGE